MSAQPKECRWCQKWFTQAAAPKAEQVYCSWRCHCEATSQNPMEPPATIDHSPLSTTAAESDTGTHTERESAAQRQGEPQ